MEITNFPSQGKGFAKTRFSGLNLPRSQEFSVFLVDKRGGESPAHDHSVSEITYVVRGGLTEIREVNGELVTNHYGEGEQFEIPAGTRHKVYFDPSDEGTITVNWCEGHLEMNIIEGFLENIRVA